MTESDSRVEPTSSVFAKFGEFWCHIMHRHDYMLQYESNRMFLHCANCGHQSPGWEISPRLSRSAAPVGVQISLSTAVGVAPAMRSRRPFAVRVGSTLGLT
jgi:hypothetical protein